MSKDINFDLKSIVPKLKKPWQKTVAHLPFIVVVVVLLVYLFVVWQIRSLGAAEPLPEDESVAAAEANVSRIDKKAIERIQQLEENSPQIRSLFNEARNNPFHE